MISHLSLELVESLITILRGCFTAMIILHLMFNFSCFFYIYQVIAVCVFAVEFMFPARKTVAVSYSVVMPVLSLAPKTVPRAKNGAAILVRTASARINVGSLVSLATRNAVGNASISDAPDCADSHVTVGDVTNHV